MGTIGEGEPSRAVDLEEQFNNTRLFDFANVTDYCGHLKNLVDQLENVGKPISETKMVLQLVSGLSKGEYDTVATIIQQSDPLPSFNEAKSILLEEEEQELRKMLDSLVHATQCRSQLCQDPNCRKVKGIFRHGILCKVRASHGCLLCNKMWHLIKLHARVCKDTSCNVTCCRELREQLRRLNQQAEGRGDGDDEAA